MWGLSSIRRAEAPHAISGVGILLGLILLGEVIVIMIGPGSSYAGFPGGVVTSIPFIGGLIYGGYWLARSELSPDQDGRIVRWWVAGLLGTVLLVGGINMSMRSMSLPLVIGTIRWSGAVGGCLGLTIGIFQAWAIQRAVETERARHRLQETEQERARLEEFASIVSHDLRSPLSVARGHLELQRKGSESAHLEAIAEALERMDAIIDDTLTLARAGLAVGETNPVELSDFVNACWRTVETADATLRIEDTARIEADEDRLRHLVENLFRNAIEHGGDDVTIRVGVLDDVPGFYVEDDGPGIPEDEWDRVFESGYSNSSDGTGFGLSIVKTITEAHGWDIRVTDSVDGGARFEITGVELTEQHAQPNAGNQPR